MHNTIPQTLSHLINTLNKNKLRPNKRLSQNFLVDKNILSKISQTCSVKKNDHILEIGPGCGALTKELLDFDANVLAIEKDHGLFAYLSGSLPNDKLQLVEADFLKCDLENLTKDLESIKVVANIPYNITSPIIEKITTIFYKLESVTLMVQKEMAERLLAKPGPNNNAFALFVQSYFEAKYLFTVSKNCYYPKPSVHSAVIQLLPKKLESLPPKDFQTFVKKLFQKRRKMLRSSFNINDLNKCDIAGTSRAEELDLLKALNLYSSQLSINL